MNAAIGVGRQARRIICLFGVAVLAAFCCLLDATLAHATSDRLNDSRGVETHRVAETELRATRYPESDEERFGLGRWYAGIHIGAVIEPDLEVRGPARNFDAIFDTGQVFDVVFGYKFNFGFRLESEFSYRSNDTDSVFFTVSKTKFGDGFGGSEVLAGFVNGWYDFDFISQNGSVFSNWVPYIGGGLGYANVSIDPGYDGTVRALDSSENGTMFQVGVGIIYRYTTEIQISLDYRYLRSVFELEFRDPLYVGTNDAVYQTHAIMLGLRGFF